MAGKGKTVKGKIAGSKKGIKPLSKSKRADLIFPVSRVTRHLKESNTFCRVAVGAPVFLAAVLEYIIGEVLESCISVAQDHSTQRISARHIFLALKNDEELSKLTNSSIIPSCGVLPNINDALLPKAKNKKPAAAQNQESG